MPTVHFLRSVWMQKRSWLYSLGFHEDRGPWTALLLFSSSCLYPASPGPQASVRLIQYPNLLLITEKNVEEEEKSKARSLSK